MPVQIPARACDYAGGPGENRHLDYNGAILGYNATVVGNNGGMVENGSGALRPGESVSTDSGERVGRSHQGWTVRLRRRVTETGFVVTTDAPVVHDATTEVITVDWATANAAFDRLMKEH